MSGHPLVDQLLLDAEHRLRGMPNLYRNAEALGNCLSVIRRYNADAYRRFAARFYRDKDEANYNACFAEIIVSAHLVMPVHAGRLKSVRWSEKEADAIAKHDDDRETFLEVLSIRPNLPPSEEALEIRTHTQDALSSVRQKIEHKMKSQRQFVMGRRNVAVVELNHYTIAGGFTVQSSLSNGYQVNLEQSSGRVVGEGFDWTSGGFLGTELGRRLNGVIDFDMGYYAGRRHLRNPFAETAISESELGIL